MHMISMRGAFKSIGAGILAILFTAGPANPAPMATPATTGAASSVCDTGFPGQPAYDRLCLVTGTPADAAYEWYTTYSNADRKTQCTAARRSGMASVVHETRGDMIGDRYRNPRAIERATVRTGTTECARRWGIRL